MALTQITGSVQASESRGSLACAVHSSHPTGKEYAGKPIDSIKKTSLFETKNQLLGKRPEPLKQTAGLLQTRHTGHHATRRRLVSSPFGEAPWKNSWTAGVSGVRKGRQAAVLGRVEGPDHSTPVGTLHPHPGAARPPSGGDVGALGAAVNSGEYFLAGHQTAATGKAAGEFLRSPQTQRSVPAAEAQFTGPRSLALRPPGNNTTLEPF